jgi:hypothetical protein
MLKYISGAFKNDYQAEFNVKLQYRDVIWVGASYRQFDGYAAMLGFNVANTFNVGYSFDYTKTDLQTFTKGTHASIKRVRGTRAYLHQVATEQPTSATLWTNEASPNPEFTFSGLISGKTYWLRVAILSSTGKTVYSSVKSCIVQ